MTDFSMSDAAAGWDAGRPYGARFPIRRLAWLAGVLLGFALLSRPTLADAAAAKDRGEAALSAARGPNLDRRERAKRSVSGPVAVLRGTLPIRPRVGPPPPGENGDDEYAAPGNDAFQPGPLYGSDWDTRFDYGGLSGTYFPVPQ
jgi:hypothetical protein